ncbi:hypothetical protein PMZ80_005992 [Knufia obscura]|uniref:Uncharacterized protein n=1 Tax=Knufia obscura TaxID=1635080 RepID=A0ABR0RPM0_9EURO|nr:hypothetical protein PMZ80_005992 [Knufia obscura]
MATTDHLKRSTASPAINDSFTLSCDPQAGSILMHLAPEIRSMIFKRLLKSDAPLWTKRTLGEEKYTDNTQLSAQILRTCQQIYHEGSLILYNENILSIAVQYWLRNFEQRPCLNILDIDIHMPRYLGEMRTSDCDLLRFAQEKITCASSEDPEESTACGCGQGYPLESPTRLLMTPWNHGCGVQAPYLISIYPVIRRFSNFRLTIDCDLASGYDTDRVFNACYMLRALFLEKHVTVHFNVIPYEHTIEKLDDAPMNKWLQKCHLPESLRDEYRWEIHTLDDIATTHDRDTFEDIKTKAIKDATQAIDVYAESVKEHIMAEAHEAVEQMDKDLQKSKKQIEDALKTSMGTSVCEDG